MHVTLEISKAEDVIGTCGGRAKAVLFERRE